MDYGDNHLILKSTTPAFSKMARYAPVPQIDTAIDVPSPQNSDFVSTGEGTKFIRVYGSPPPCSDLRQGPSTEIVKSNDPKKLIDVLDSWNEEPFTLETLDSLIQMHWVRNIDFVLARVTTVDSRDDNKFYYSYYAAHHINKVLFRKQPEEGLLHRMRAKNPLNNMTIVGDVHYYVIKPKTKQPLQINIKVPKSPLEQIHELLSPISPSTARSKQIYSNISGKDVNSISLIPKIEFLIKKDLYEPEGIEMKERSSDIISERRNSYDDAFSDAKVQKPLSSSTTIVLEQRHRNVRSLAYANDGNQNISADEWIKSNTKCSDTKSLNEAVSPRKRHQKQSSPTTPLIEFYEAFYYASDDDYLMHSSVRKYFKQNVLETDDALLFTIQNSNTVQGEDHPSLANLALVFGENESQRSRIRRRIKWSVSVYIIISFVILRFLGNH